LSQFSLCFFWASRRVDQATLSFSRILSRSHKGSSLDSFISAQTKQRARALWLVLLFFKSEYLTLQYLRP
jgi:hypothetical protein